LLRHRSHHFIDHARYQPNSVLAVNTHSTVGLFER
jgi:hypothetical protein